MALFSGVPILFQTPAQMSQSRQGGGLGQYFARGMEAGLQDKYRRDALKVQQEAIRARQAAEDAARQATIIDAQNTANDLQVLAEVTLKYKQDPNYVVPFERFKKPESISRMLSVMKNIQDTSSAHQALKDRIEIQGKINSIPTTEDRVRARKSLTDGDIDAALDIINRTTIKEPSKPAAVRTVDAIEQIETDAENARATGNIDEANKLSKKAQLLKSLALPVERLDPFLLRQYDAKIDVIVRDPYMSADEKNTAIDALNTRFEKLLRQNSTESEPSYFEDFQDWQKKKSPTGRSGF